MNETLSSRLTLKNVRVGYVHVFEPSQIGGTGEPKYSLVALIPKTDVAQINAINAAMQVAYNEGMANPKKWAGRQPAVLDVALKDGDTTKDLSKNPEYEGMYYINVKDKNKPIVVDRSRNAITDPSGFYSGCFANVICQFFPFLNTGKYGISASLQGVQFVSDGERLAAGGASANDFDALDGDTAPFAGAPFGGTPPPFGGR